MLGGMLAGHDEGGGEMITRYFKSGEVTKTDTGLEDLIEERKFVNFYGMSSKAANEKHFGGLKEYRSSEGREIQVPYRGDIESTIQDLLGGVRSTCTYAGAKKLKWLSKCTTFVKTNQQFNSVFTEK
jgi:GMP reductase